MCAQVTSPIRRYPDLAVHYQLKAHLRGEPLPFDSDALLHLARESGGVARKLERNANAYWVLEWLKRHAGQPMQALCLGSPFDRRQKGVSKLLLIGRGVIVDCKPRSPLPLGATVEVAPDRDGELIVRSVSS